MVAAENGPFTTKPTPEKLALKAISTAHEAEISQLGDDLRKTRPYLSDRTIAEWFLYRRLGVSEDGEDMVGLMNRDYIYAYGAEPIKKGWTNWEEQYPGVTQARVEAMALEEQKKGVGYEQYCAWFNQAELDRRQRVREWQQEQVEIIKNEESHQP